MPRLLFVGDIHLGRRPSRLPPDLTDLGLRPGDLGPAAAWRATVELALREKVDAVVLAGDVVESLHDRFAAYGQLEEGVARLAAAGVPVLGVAGNHDVEALPRLAARLDGFRLLGAGGRWEHADVDGADGRGVRLLGWSFPEPRYAGDPLEGLSVRSEAGRPVLGVLHCDLDGPRGGPYASVRRTDLERLPVDAWLLGHVHRPDPLEGERPLGYLGSLVGLDPGEPGAHGPVLVHVEAAAVRARRVPLAPLQWARETVDLASLGGAAPAEGNEGPVEVPAADAAPAAGHTGDATPTADLTDALEALEDAVHAALRRVGSRLADAGAAARLAGVRLVLTGRSPHHLALARAAQDGSLARLRHNSDGRTVFIEKIIDEGAATLDLERLARSDHPPGRLARRLLTLEAGGPAAEALIRAAAPRLRSAASERAFAGLDPAPTDPEAFRSALLEAGYEALEHLLAEGAAP